MGPQVSVSTRKRAVRQGRWGLEGAELGLGICRDCGTEAVPPTEGEGCGG